MSSVASLALSAIERGRELLEHVDYRLAETSVEREQIYRLRYRAYLHEGVIEPRADQRVTDRFDDLSNTWIFGVYFDGVLASSLRISLATSANPISPSVEASPDLLRPELAKGRIIVDPTRFVADPVRSRHARELPYLTVRLGYIACIHFDADIALATVRPEHAAFYRRVFLHETIAPSVQPPGMIKPFCIMATECHKVQQRIYERYPYFHATLFERRTLFERHNPISAVPSVQPQPIGAGLTSVRLAAQP